MPAPSPLKPSCAPSPLEPSKSVRMEASALPALSVPSELLVQHSLLMQSPSRRRHPSHYCCCPRSWRETLWRNLHSRQRATEQCKLHNPDRAPTAPPCGGCPPPSRPSGPNGKPCATASLASSPPPEALHMQLPSLRNVAKEDLEATSATSQQHLHRGTSYLNGAPICWHNTHTHTAPVRQPVGTTSQWTAVRPPTGSGPWWFRGAGLSRGRRHTGPCFRIDPQVAEPSLPGSSRSAQPPLGFWGASHIVGRYNAYRLHIGRPHHPGL